MNRLTDELAKLACIDFFQILKRESHPKNRIRCLALGHLESGKTKNEVAHMFQVILTAFCKWLLRISKCWHRRSATKGCGKRGERKLSSEREEKFREQAEQLQGSLGCCDAWNAFTSGEGAIRQACSIDWVKTKNYF